MRQDQHRIDRIAHARGAGLLAMAMVLAASPALASSEPGPASIVTDEEFKAGVPDFPTGKYPALEGPLESIEAFEARLSGQTGEPDAAAPSVSGEAPVHDAELLKPLPSIEHFEVAPVQFAGKADAGEGGQVAYSVRLNGMEQADRESAVGLRSLFNRLSALRQGGGKAANAAMIQARLTEDGQLVETILASEGWYAPTIATRMDRTGEGESGPIAAVIDVSPGARFTLEDIRIDAGPTIPPDLIRSSLALKSGEPIIAERVQGAEAQVAVTLGQQGYPFVEVGERSILLDRATAKGDYVLPVQTGPRSVFNGFETTGKPAFDARHVGLLARFGPGELYDSRKVDDLRKALVATGLFAAVSVEPRRTGKRAGDGDEYVTMLVKQDAGPPRTIAGSAGYGTGEGYRLEATWTHRNLFPPEGALIAHGLAGTKEQGAGLTFRRSNAGRRDRTFELAAEGLHNNFDAYSAYTGRLAVQWRYNSTPIWQKHLTYAYGGELLATAEKDYDFALGRKDRRLYYIASLNGQAGLDHTDDLLDPTRGFRLTAFVRPEAALDGDFNFHVRTQLDASAYYPLGDGLVVAGRVRVGSIQGARRDEIAPSRRFYAGGGGSVRGFAYQKLGPIDPDGDPLGGRSLTEASAEVRYRFGTFGVAGFVDGGQAYTASLPAFSDLRLGAGVGVRYYTNFGPVRVDVATPINRRAGEGRFNLYVSIGQAF